MPCDIRKADPNQQRKRLTVYIQKLTTDPVPEKEEDDEERRLPTQR